MLMLLDLSAAFDTVNHGTLLRRQEKSYGLRGRVLRWSSSYINGRTQSVQRGPGRSAALFLTCGEPQGPVLGSILFLLYTADLIPLIERHALIPHLYADDTQILGFCSPSRTASLRDVRLHRQGVTVDAKQPTSAKHDQDRHSLVRYQPTAASDTADTNTAWLRLRYDSQISAGPLHLYLDADISMTTHVTKSASSCFAASRQIPAIRRSLTRPVLLSLIVSLVMPRKTMATPR